MKKIIKYTSIVLTSAAIVALPVFSASAETSNTVITANIGSTISVQSTSNVALNINPTATQAKASSGKATVTVSTNNATGYNLKIGMNGADRNLNKATDNITAHAGTLAAPTALANNTWGYRVENVGGFNAGNVTPENNVNDLAGTFAGVPAQNAEEEIKNHNAAVQSNTTDVLFGAKVDATKPSGAYTGTVVFTATAN
jgi:hypothetical protein